MPKRKVTSRFKSTDMFSRRLVITVSRSGIMLIAGATVLGLTVPVFYGRVLTIVSTCIAIVALVSLVEARYQLRNFRYEIREQITALRQTWVVPSDLPDLRESVDAIFENSKDDAETSFIRVPKPR